MLVFDRVILFREQGLPIDTNGDGYPDTDSGMAMYGPGGVFGQYTDHRAPGDAAPMFTDDDSQPFYDEGYLVQSAEVWINVDDLDRVTFYDNELDAVNGAVDAALPLYEVGVGGLMMVAAWTDDDGSKQQADLVEWNLETDAELLDAGAVGEDFGASVKARLSGAGTLTGHLSNRFVDTELCNPSSRMLRLVLMTRRGAQAKAVFRFGAAGAEAGCMGTAGLSVEADILFSSADLSVTSSDQTTRIAAQFVTTGPFRYFSERRT